MPSKGERSQYSAQTVYLRPLQDIISIFSDRRSQREIDADQAAEEYRQVNDVILTEEPRYLPLDDDCADTCSESTMATAIEDIPPLVPLARLKSRYDKISTSALADYMSLASLAITDKPADTVSVATTATAMYFSVAETEEDEEESSLSDLVVGPVKSASAYNLAARARKRSMVFKSFDRELDTVLEQGHEHLPLVMTFSVSSNNSAEDATLCESPPPSPRRRLSSTDDDTSFSSDAPSPHLSSLSLHLPPLPPSSFKDDGRPAQSERVRGEAHGRHVISRIT